MSSPIRFDAGSHMCVTSDAEATSAAPSEAAPVASAPAARGGQATHTSEPLTPQMSAGAEQLIKQRSQSPAAQFVAKSAKSVDARQPIGATSQQRMADVPLQLLHADAGFTDGGLRGRGDVHAEGALLKGKNGLLQAEVAGVSLQAGRQLEAAATVARVTVEDDAGDTTVDAMTANASWGSRQAKNGQGAGQGSYGATATLIGVERTHTFEGGNSVTVGLSAGFGARIDLDVRDSDNDGHTEECAKVSLSVVEGVTLGACVEPHKAYAAIAEGARAVSTWFERL